MDIGKLNLEGEWLEIETENEEFGALKVLVLPESLSGAARLWRDDFSGYVAAAIADWDLNDKGEKIPCDEENKAKYIPVLARMRIKNPVHTMESVVVKTIGSEIIAFSQDLKNFTKN